MRKSLLFALLLGAVSASHAYGASITFEDVYPTPAPGNVGLLKYPPPGFQDAAFLLALAPAPPNILGKTYSTAA